MPMDGRWREVPAGWSRSSEEPARGPVAARGPSGLRGLLVPPALSGLLVPPALSGLLVPPALSGLLVLPGLSALLVGACAGPSFVLATADGTTAESEGEGTSAADPGDPSGGVNDPASSTGGATSPATSTAGDDTTTGDVGEEATSEGAGGEVTPPTIDAFTVSPGGLHAAGPLTFTLECSDDVIDVELVEETLGVVATLTPADFPYDYIVAGDEHNDHGRFRAIVHGAAATTAESALVEVDIGLPPPGLAVWTAKYGDAASAALSVFPYHEGAVAVGYRFDGFLVRARVIRFGAEGEVMWERTPVLTAGYASAVTVDADDHVIVVGNRYVKDYQAMWVRAYDAAGDEIEGAAVDGSYGTRGLAVAAAPAGGYYIAGDVREPGTPNCHDVRLYGFGLPGPDVDQSWAGPWIAEQVCLDDQGLAIAVLADGQVAIAGVTGVYLGSGEGAIASPRILALRFTAGGSLLGTFVDDDSPYLESQGWAVADDGAGGMIVGGRTGPDIDALSFPVVHRLDAAMEERWWRILPGGGRPEASVEGLALSLSGDVVIAATVVGEDGDTDIFLGELDGETAATWLWKEPIDVFALDDRAHHLALDPYGHLHVAGIATLEGGERAFVRRVSP